MKVVEIETVSKNYKYIAVDSREFSNKRDCERYEASLAYKTSIIKECGSKRIIKCNTEEAWKLVCKYFHYAFSYCSSYDSDYFYEIEDTYLKDIGKYLILDYENNSEVPTVQLVDEWLEKTREKIDKILKQISIVEKYTND